MTKYVETYKELMDKKDKYDYICLFGVGDAADKYWYRFVIDRGFKVDFFSDNNTNKWGKVIVDGISCIAPNEILNYGNKILCLVSTSVLYTNEIVLQLRNMGVDVIGLDTRWFNIKCIIEYYLQIKIPDVVYPNSNMGEYDRKFEQNEKVAVYTCIIDDYDDLKQPRIVDQQCDYFCLSYEKPKELGIYKWIDIAPFIRGMKLDNIRINRFCKLHPHLFFEDYKYSIYYDGSIEIIHSIVGLVRKIGDIGIGLYEAGGYGNLDIYGEAALLALSQRMSGDTMEIMLKQILRYIEEGFPRNFGEAINGIIAREHNNVICINIMETWWKEIVNESKRDQLSFWYAVWKNGYLPHNVGKLGNSLRIGTEYIIHDHKKNLYKDNFIY